MIVWTDHFPTSKRPLGYLRLLKARHRYFVHYGLDRWGRPVKRPGYQMEIRSWRDMYRGRPCFVIGNGPSLAKMDLSPLASEITIGCNGIYKSFPEWGFHTTFLLFEDTEQTELRGPDIHDVRGPIKMASIYNAYAFGADKNTYFFNARRADGYYWKQLAPRFSEEFDQIVYLGSTVTTIGLQLAFHLGCDPVYLIGCDHTYGELGKRFPPGKLTITEENYPLVQECHFSKDYYKIGQVIGVPNVAIQEAAYGKAREVYEKHGRTVLNAGVDSHLDVFERKPFSEIFAGRRLKVLFLSHAATRSGAPLSLRTLVRHFRDRMGWEPRLLVRKRNGEIGPFAELGPADFFYKHFYPDRDGTHSHSSGKLIVNHLKAIRQKGFHPRALLATLAQRRDRMRRQAAHEAELRRQLRRWQPDLIYSNTALNGDVIDKLGLEGVPVVAHVRELADTFKLLNPAQLESFRRRPDYYLPVSGAVRDYLAAEQKIPTERMSVAPVALEHDRLRELAEAVPTEAIREQLGLAEGALLIGGVGYLNERKGPDIFLAVAKKVIDQLGAGQPVHFVWLGEGELLTRLRQRSEKFGIRDKVTFTGLVDNPYPYIRAMDLVLMTSRDDPFPRVNLEAGLFGVPMIAFDGSGGSREFAEDQCGLVVPHLDIQAMHAATVKLVRDPALRRQLGDNARRKVLEQYGVETVAPAIEARLREHLPQLARRLDGQGGGGDS